jgi:hypothetical protein
MNTNLTKPLPYNYKWFNGVVLNDSETDSYNNYTKDADAATWKETKELILDNRHKFLIGRFEHHLATTN